MVIGSNILAGSSGQGGGYNISRSLRFRSSASAYLSRTPASAGNRQIWTWSAWVKVAQFPAQAVLFAANTSSPDTIEFGSGNLGVWLNGGSNGVVTSAVYRDPSAWYHIVVAVDTTQATSSNRVKIYVNGSQVTALGTANYPSQNLNTNFNNTVEHNLCRKPSANYFEGYLAEVNFIDGQALTPSSFGETSSTTGVWQPKRYSGTYGTNGFYLPFTDNSALTSGSNAGLGKDFSGNGNYWNTNNISITSGSTYDSMTDVPTLTSATAANFSTLNPLSIYVVSPTDGNLAFSGTSAGGIGTMGASSGKYYWECVYTAIGSGDGVLVGIRSTDSIATGAAENVGYYGGGTQSGNKIINGGAATAYGATWTTGDVIGVALDLDGGTVTFYKNNVSQGAISFTVGGKSWTSFNWRTGSAGTNTASINFGQRPFAYTPPTGYVALNTYNLPTPTIGATASSQANKYMDVTTYTGNSSTQTITNSGSMQPDFVWIKNRTDAYSHQLFDSLRGVYKYLQSNTTIAEGTDSTMLTSFNSNGFSVGSNANVNNNSQALVGWQWKANGSGSSNTDGSITSTVSANTTSGFSVVTYTGNGSAGATVGHGLGVAPAMTIIKTRTGGSYYWIVWHKSLASYTNNLYLNDTAAVQADSNYTALPSSTVLTLNSGRSSNVNTNTYVAYCFSEVAGFSKFGSYTGNGSTDGPFVYLGFRPKYVMVKNSTAATWNWFVFDSARNTYNVTNTALLPNDSGADNTNTAWNFDFVSNGFKIRGTNGNVNNNGDTYIYACFAENPFKYSLAR